MSYLSQWRQDYSKFIIKAYSPMAQQAIDNSVKAMKAQYNPGIKQLNAPFIDKFIADRGGKLIREVSEEQFRAINVLVRQASLSDTMSAAELAKAIRPTVGLTQRQSQATYNYYERAKEDALKAGKTEADAEAIARKKQAVYAEKMHRMRADTIAITETAYAYNWGQQSYMKQCIDDGLIGSCQKQWLTALDERVCDVCGKVDKEIAEMDDDFSVGVLVPPAHPRCRCVVNYINVTPPKDWVQDDPDTQAAMEPDEVEIPDDLDLDLTIGNKAHLGGTGEMWEATDSSGTDYLFKPAYKKGTQQVEEFRAHVQEAGYKVQGIIDPESSVPVGTLTADIPGQGQVFGAAQMRITDIDTSFDLRQWQDNGGQIDPSIIAQLQRENVTDWLLCNYDSHGGNFIMTQDGRLIGVDKEQSFRFIGQSGAQSMSLTYHPNSIVGEREPIYNTMYRRFANGELDIQLNDTLAYIKRVEAIPDAEYREIFRPYAESLYGKGGKADALLDQIVSRKQNVRKTFEDFYSGLLTQRKGTPTTFQFADTGGTVAFTTPSPATQYFSPETLKVMKLADLHEIAKAKGIKNFGIMHKDELIECISDPSKIQQIHDTATERARKIGQERKARKLQQQTGIREMEGVPQLSDAIKNPEAVLQNAGPRGVALIGDTTALEGMEATMRKVTIDGEEYIELTGKMTQTRWTQAITDMSAAQNGTYWRYNQVVGEVDYTQPVLTLSSTTEKISLGTKYIRNGDDILIVSGSAATNDERALMGQFNIRVKAGPDAGARLQSLLSQAKMTDVTADATADALDRYKKMRVIWQTDPAEASKLDAATATDAQIDTVLRRLGITQSRLDAVKVTKIQDGYWTLTDPENVALAKKHSVEYVYHQIFDSDDVPKVLKSGELMATANRWGRGILNSNGMSSSEDMRTGGGDSVFTRLVFKDQVGNTSPYSSHAVSLVFDPKILARTDWYAYTGDRYGKTTDRYMSGRYGTEAHFKELRNYYNGSNEVMFRRTLPLDSALLEVRVPSARDRDAILDKLRQDGITQINGHKIEDFIKLGGSTL